MTNTAAIATKLNVLESAIVQVEEWAHVLFVVVKGLGARFVSKKIGVEQVKSQVRRATWQYGDNFELWIDGSMIESWSTKDFTVGGFLAVFSKKYNLNKEEIEICEGVDNTYRKVVPNHQEILLNMQMVESVYDPRIESNDFDPDEII